MRPGPGPGGPRAGTHRLSAEDRVFRDAFEDGRIEPGAFDHRAHVRLAYAYLVEDDGDADGATRRMRDGLLAFLRRRGEDTSKYHETITGAWILAVRHFMESSERAASADAFIDANPALLDSRIMMSHYSAELLFSPGAREGFVEADLDPIPRHPPVLDPAVRSYYERRPEEHRLTQGAFQIEGERTRELIERFAPGAPAVVYDVGGAGGFYALWLANAGYEVHLVDAVPRLVDVARAASADAERPLASARVGDARALPFPDASADVVLLLGPLYHLVEAADRARALAEAARVLRPGGMLFAACITRWASLLDGLAFDFLADPHFAELVEEDLRAGRHRNPTERQGYFTTAYFHEPEEFASELRASGLALEGVLGIEGPTRMLVDFGERWADPRRRADMLRVARELEREPSTLGISPHLLGVAVKPRGRTT